MLRALASKARAEYRDCRLTVRDVLDLRGKPCTCGAPAYHVERIKPGDFTRANMRAVCDACRR